MRSGVPAMQQPEAYIGGAAGLFDAEGKLTNGKTREFLQTFTVAFDRWVDVHQHAKKG
jgi:chromate reductase, NAD(P)H dehydrogenase (quinone)